MQERTCALRTRRNEWTIIGETSENAGHSFPSACRSRHKYRSNTRTCTCMRTDRAPTPLLLAPLLMRFVRLRQVLRGRAPRWRKSQGCFVRRGSMTRCCFRRKNSGPSDPLRPRVQDKDSNFAEQIKIGWKFVIVTLWTASCFPLHAFLSHLNA